MDANHVEGDLPVQCFEITTSYSSTSRILEHRRSGALSYPIASRLHDIRSRSGVCPDHFNNGPSVNNPDGKNVCSQENIRSIQPQGASTKQAICTVAAIFTISLLSLVYIYMKFPELEPEERKHVKLPWDIEDAKLLGQVLDRYKEKYFFEVLLAVFITYIFLQTFAIPGSISLSILSGFLFPFPLALVLVCFCSATGASLCYVLSYFLGRRIVYKYFPQKAAHWAATVSRHRDNLLNYLLFLRVTPFLPNWFINIVSPVIDVPLFPFWLGTFIGVAPPSFVAIQAGQTLYKLSASSDAWSWTSVMLLAVFALLSLAPVLFRKGLRDKFD